MLKGKQIVCFSNYYWGPLKQRYEHLMLNFAKFNRVLFVEFDADIARQSVRGSLLDWIKSPRKINDNFYVVSAPPTLPLKYTIPLFNKISQKINLLYYRRVLKKLGFKDFILWLTRPAHFELAGNLGEKITIYDCVDEHSDFHLVMQKHLIAWQKKIVVEMEKKLFEKAHLAFVSSQQLYTSKNMLNKRTYLIPNACDVNHFGKARLPETIIPEIMKNINKPVIGFVGLLDPSRIDVGLLESIAEAYPAYSLVLIGPDWLKPNKLNSYKNVYFIGEVKYEQLPGYLKAIDVAIIPFKRNNAVKNINPLKIYEYLSAGKPVVCSNFAEIGMFSNVIKIANNKQEFLKYIGLSLKEDSEDLIRKRVLSVKEHTWKNRVEEMSQHIESCLN